MVSPLRKRESVSPRKPHRHLAREELPDTGLDTSFDLFDIEVKESSWYSVRIPGTLPPKRSFHSTTTIGNKYFNV